jgi:hypothetical protein
MPERDSGASVASPTLGGPVAAGAAVPCFKKEKTMSFESDSPEGLMRRKEMTMATTMTEIRAIDRDEMAGVDGGYYVDPSNPPFCPPYFHYPLRPPIVPPPPIVPLA